MFARTNEELAKQFPDKKLADFLGGIDITDVKDFTSGRTLTTRNKQQALTVQLEKPLLKDEEVTLVLTYRPKMHLVHSAFLTRKILLTVPTGSL